MCAHAHAHVHANTCDISPHTLAPSKAGASGQTGQARHGLINIMIPWHVLIIQLPKSEVSKTQDDRNRN